MNTKKIRYDEKDGSFAFFASIVFPLILQLFLQIVLILICSITKQNVNTAMTSSIFTIVTYLCLEGVFFLTYILYGKKCKINTYTASKVKFKIDFAHVCYLICVPIICVFAFNNFVGLFDQLLKIIGYNNTTQLPLPLNTFGWFILNVFLMAVLPAISEEVLFRGMIMNGFKRFGETKAIFISAILFALFHTSPSQTIYQFILGIVLGYAVVKSGSLIAGMIVHFINNFIVLLINYIAVRQGTTEILTTFNALHVFKSLLFAGLGVLIIFLIYKYGMKTSPEKKMQRHQEYQMLNEKPREKQPIGQMYLWIGILIAVALWVYNFIHYTFLN